MGIVVEKLVEEICGSLGVEYVELLDSGAQKSAFLVRKQGTPLALKVAKNFGGADDRFKREIHALRACEHDSIARLYHVSLERYEGIDIWIMLEEYLPGGTLQKIKCERRCSVSELLEIAEKLISALEHLRERGIVHRDIKPANILFREPSIPVLTDFGIARVLTEPSLTKDFLPQGPGTPLYSSPEQLVNDKPSIDWRSDQFALAVVLSEWILGHHPFQDGPYEPQKIVGSIANRCDVPDKTIYELNSLRLHALVKAMSPWPISRFRLTSQFAAALSEGGL